MKTLTINGTNFELKVPRKNKVTISEALEYLERYKGRTIYDCYERPSVYKEAIYSDWLCWLRTTVNVGYFGVTGYNCMQFSLGALAWIDDKYYLLRITRDHNIAVELTGYTAYTFND